MKKTFLSGLVALAVMGSLSSSAQIGDLKNKVKNTAGKVGGDKKEKTEGSAGTGSENDESVKGLSGEDLQAEYSEQASTAMSEKRYQEAADL
jgi:hypothetical protein